MGHQIGKVANKLKAVFAELRQFEEYVDAYLKEISFQVFTVKETQAAMIEHLGCEAEVIEIIKRRQAEADKERERIKAEAEAKKAEREAEAQKLHDAVGPDGAVGDAN